MPHGCMKTRMVLIPRLQKPVKNNGNVKNVTECSQIIGRYLIIKSNFIHISYIRINLSTELLLFYDTFFKIFSMLLCYRKLRRTPLHTSSRNWNWANGFFVYLSNI